MSLDIAMVTMSGTPPMVFLLAIFKYEINENDNKDDRYFSWR